MNWFEFIFMSFKTTPKYTQKNRNLSPIRFSVLVVFPCPLQIHSKDPKNRHQFVFHHPIVHTRLCAGDESGSLSSSRPRSQVVGENLWRLSSRIDERFEELRLVRTHTAGSHWIEFFVKLEQNPVFWSGFSLISIFFCAAIGQRK